MNFDLGESRPDLHGIADLNDTTWPRSSHATDMSSLSGSVTFVSGGTKVCVIASKISRTFSEI
jgi:hypothetical protein